MSVSGLKTAARGLRDEERNWARFRRRTGRWPVWSISTFLISTPTLFALATFILVRALETNSQRVIYPALIVTVICTVSAWFGLRALALRLDRGHKEQR